MKAIWTGAIGFGLVNIPIKIFSATQTSSLDLDMLDRKDHSNIKYKRVNESTGKEVTWDNIVKGYLLKDKYVVLEDADFEEAMPEKNKMINLQTFVKLQTVFILTLPIIWNRKSLVKKLINYYYKPLKKVKWQA